MNRCGNSGDRGVFNRCGDSGNRDSFNKCGDNNCEFVNGVRNGRSFRDGTVEGLGSVGVSSLEYSRSGDSRYFVNSSTVRRRGVLEFEQFVSDPAPNV